MVSRATPYRLVSERMERWGEGRDADERDSEERVKVSEHIVTETHAGQTAERAFYSQRPRPRVRLVRRVSEQLTRGTEIRPGWRGKRDKRRFDLQRDVQIARFKGQTRIRSTEARGETWTEIGDRVK